MVAALNDLRPEALTAHPSVAAALLREVGAVPPPDRGHPVPRIDRDPGHGAKCKLVRSLATPSS
jgi:hypothetical protein